MIYLLQSEDVQWSSTPVLNDIASDASSAISLEIWNGHVNPQDVLVVSIKDIKMMPEATLRKAIPIGSIEFTETVMERAFRIEHMKPLNVPLPLSVKKYWKRRMSLCFGVEAVNSIFEDWHTDTLFIKSGSRLKTPITGLYHKGELTEVYKDDPLLLVSEPISLSTEKSAEWRLFVKDHKIIDLRCYAGNPWMLPDKDMVAEIADKIPDNIRCATLDVAVTDSGDTVIVELHNFVSCDSYGADLPLSMYRFGYIDELKRYNVSFGKER